MLLFGATQFLDLFNEAIVAFREFSQPQLDLWPNIYITVGELKRLHLSEIIHLIGGLQVLFWSLLSIIYHGYNLITQSPWLKTKVNKPKDNTALETQKSTMIDTTFTASSKADCYPFNILFTLIICATASLLITMSALRFTLLTLPPLVLLAAISIDSCVKVCINFKMMNNRFIIYLLSVFVYSIFLAWPITMINKEIKADFLSDIYNDTWHAALTKTKAMTPEDSIVTSWWPPGHFIKSIADRSVTFDGASINYPQAYWLSRFLLASDENFALGILRMLNNSGNKTVELLSAKTNWPLSKVIDVILTITGQSSFSALQTLEQFISDTNLIMNVLALTHSQPRPSYFLLYNDMVENQIQFPFFGNWPFKRIEEINADPKKLKLVPSPSNKKAHVKFLWDLAGGTTAHTGPYQRISQQEDIIKFAEGIYFNPKDKSVVVDSEKHGKGRPFSVIFQENDSVIEYKQNNPNLNYSVIITQDHTDSYAFITSQQMARSLLMRLFYFKDTGLKHIKHLFTEIDLTRRTQIQLYEINWLSFFDELNNKTPAAQKNN